MFNSPGPLLNLLPEFYPIITAFLPLHATPSTLLALALTRRDISRNAIHLLYSCLILKNEDDAITVLQRLVDNPSLGRNVRELHIMSGLSVRTRNQDPPLDVIRRVEDVISRGYLPFIHTLGLYLSNGWYYIPNTNDYDYEEVRGFGQLRGDAWVKIKEKCPRLRGLLLDGFTDDKADPWAEESGLLELDDITHLQMHFNGLVGSQSSNDKLLGNISSLAQSLHTLDLKLGSFHSPTSAIFKLDLPCLRSLSLMLFTQLNTNEAMAFFERHPAIEYLNLESYSILGGNHWFSQDLPPKLLPNLRHLQANWNEVRRLAPIVGQLRSLSIDESVNSQIPYLFRLVLPNGLPNLQSLNIGQRASSSSQNKTIEGALWYEDYYRGFSQIGNTEWMSTVFDHGYLYSIVSAAPNLEELGFFEPKFRIFQFTSISTDLNRFSRLKHLYYAEYYPSLEELTKSERNKFSSHARDLAGAVPGLVSISAVGTLDLSYLRAQIKRAEAGEVVSVEVGKGYGMKIGHENEAFPG